MATTVKEIKEWLNTLNDSDAVGVDDGGLALMTTDEQHYLEIGGLPRFINHYRCPCGEEWENPWSCKCNDRCPKCDTEVEPYESEEA